VLPEEVILALDDYHLIEAPAVHEGLLALLDQRLAGLRLVSVGRADPPLPLARLRARGELVELRAEALRFTGDEATDFLARTMGLALTSEAAAALAGRVEGWAAGRGPSASPRYAAGRRSGSPRTASWPRPSSRRWRRPTLSGRPT
jgi:LuxR family maltose regulon positive regulatory protein